jgi:hypothetical protein
VHVTGRVVDRIGQQRQCVADRVAVLPELIEDPFDLATDRLGHGPVGQLTARDAGLALDAAAVEARRGPDGLDRAGQLLGRDVAPLHALDPTEVAIEIGFQAIGIGARPTTLVDPVAQLLQQLVVRRGTFLVIGHDGEIVGQHPAWKVRESSPETQRCVIRIRPGTEAP